WSWGGNLPQPRPSGADVRSGRAGAGQITVRTQSRAAGGRAPFVWRGGEPRPPERSVHRQRSARSGTRHRSQVPLRGRTRRRLAARPRPSRPRAAVARGGDPAVATDVVGCSRRPRTTAGGALGTARAGRSSRDVVVPAGVDRYGGTAPRTRPRVLFEARQAGQLCPAVRVERGAGARGAGRLSRVGGASGSHADRGRPGGTGRTHRGGLDQSRTG